VSRIAIMLLGVFLLPGVSLADEPPSTSTEKAKYDIGLPKTIFRDVPESFHNIAKRPFQDLVVRLVRTRGEVELIADPMVLAEKLDSGKLDLGVLQGHEYAWAKVRFPDLVPLVCAAQMRDIPIQAVILVRADCDAKCVADLKNRTLTVPTGTKDHARLFLEREYHKAGVRPAANICTPMLAHDGIEDVIEGKAEVTVVDRAAWESYQLLNRFRAKKVRVLDSSEIFPSGVIVYKKGCVSPEMLERFRAGLMSAATDSQGKYLLNLIKLKGFDDIPASYEKQLSDCLKAYPSPKEANPFRLTSFEKK
jgi:ABC-type phosphate/phosphonate transport system substrate-binding protein